jgi:hypothetical protein
MLLAQIIGGSFTDASGNALAGGQAVFQLSNDEATNPAGSEIGAGISVSATLDSSGNVITSPATYLYISTIQTADTFKLTVCGMLLPD